MDDQQSEQDDPEKEGHGDWLDSPPGVIQNTLAEGAKDDEEDDCIVDGSEVRNQPDENGPLGNYQAKNLAQDKWEENEAGDGQQKGRDEVTGSLSGSAEKEYTGQRNPEDPDQVGEGGSENADRGVSPRAGAENDGTGDGRWEESEEKQTAGQVGLADGDENQIAGREDNRCAKKYPALDE